MDLVVLRARRVLNSALQGRREEAPAALVNDTGFREQFAHPEPVTVLLQMSKSRATPCSNTFVRDPTKKGVESGPMKLLDRLLIVAGGVTHSGGEFYDTASKWNLPRFLGTLYTGFNLHARFVAECLALECN